MNDPHALIAVDTIVLMFFAVATVILMLYLSRQRDNAKCALDMIEMLEEKDTIPLFEERTGLTILTYYPHGESTQPHQIRFWVTTVERAESELTTLRDMRLNSFRGWDSWYYLKKFFLDQITSEQLLASFPQEYPQQ